MSSEILDPGDSLLDAVRAIESSPKRLAVVVDRQKHILGTLTDGDIRRALLHGDTLDTSVSKAMNTNPVVANIDATDNSLLNLMRENNIRSIPLVNHIESYIRTACVSEIAETANTYPATETFAAAVIMAGGEGTRLRPLTENIPKPMVEINGVPLLERQINKLKNAGINDIFISVNYLKDIIIDHFGDGSSCGVSIEYLHENQKLGTAGALALMPRLPDGASIIVMNGDVLTTSDFSHLYHFHVEHNSVITLSAIDYRVSIPYGVVECEGAAVTGLAEKPSQRFFCNAGIYAISPEILHMIPVDTLYHMTDLVEHCLNNAMPVSVFPVHEYWSDIGTPGDLERAREEFLEQDLYVSN